MRTVFFIPALNKLSGGLANIYSIAKSLTALGKDVALMGPSPDAASLREAEAGGMTVLPWGTTLRPSDTWCVPESWPNAISVGVEAKARTIVYVQNWIFLLTTLPAGVRWSTLPVEFLAVSRPVAWFMHHALGLSTKGILPASVAPFFFREQNRSGSHIRIAYMPRKNRALTEQIRTVTMACLAEQVHAPKVEWVEIQNLSRQEVAEKLAQCQLFLSTGFPEGFGLPPLEAMASGCVPVGFTGFGGWEYMRQACVEGFCPGYAPDANGFGDCLTGYTPEIPFPSGQPALSEMGNGFFFSDGDTLGAGMALAKAAAFASQKADSWLAVEEACRNTARLYSEEAQQQAISQFFG